MQTRLEPESSLPYASTHLNRTWFFSSSIFGVGIQRPIGNLKIGHETTAQIFGVGIRHQIGELKCGHETAANIFGVGIQHQIGGANIRTRNHRGLFLVLESNAKFGHYNLNTKTPRNIFGAGIQHQIGGTKIWTRNHRKKRKRQNLPVPSKASPKSQASSKRNNLPPITFSWIMKY